MQDGIPADRVLAELAERHQQDDPHADRPGMVNTYDSGLPAVEHLAKEAYGMYLHVNALFSATFPSVYGMERDVVEAATELLHGPAGATGSWTSGGNESCIMAVKAARDARPDIKNPKMVVPISAHPAWIKGARYLGLEAVITPIDPVTFRADVGALRGAIDDRTVIVVQSAPQYAHGVIDPIEEVAAICRARGRWLQVDACIGGWVLPFAERQGHRVPPWDFRVDGVHSITVDPQKYGYTPKGCSLVLYRNAELRRHQFFTYAGWTGYPLANSTMQSSKAGGLLAAAWAVMRHIGDDGYMRLVKETLRAKQELVDGIRGIAGLVVMGDSESSLFALTTRGIDFFVFVDELRRRGWTMQPQPSQPGIPPSVHFTMSAHHGPYLAGLITAMREAAAATRLRSPLVPESELARIRALPHDSGPEVVGPLLMQTFEGGEVSTRTFAVLDALPLPLREMAMLGYFESLTAPR